MTNERELLRRALGFWENPESDRYGTEANKMFEEISAYLEKRADAAQRLKHLQEFGFCDTDPEKSYVESGELLDCPHCGGSGHAGDVPKDEPVRGCLIPRDLLAIPHGFYLGANQERGCVTD